MQQMAATGAVRTGGGTVEGDRMGDHDSFSTSAAAALMASTGGQFHPQHPPQQQQLRKMFGKNRGQSSNQIVYNHDDNNIVFSPYSQYLQAQQVTDNLPQLFTTMNESNQEPKLISSATADKLKDKSRKYDTDVGHPKKRKQVVSQTAKKPPTSKFEQQDEQLSLMQQYALTSHNNSRENLEGNMKGSSLFMKYVKKKHQQHEPKYVIVANDQGGTNKNVIQIVVPDNN
jgi:hypothetical protein